MSADSTSASGRTELHLENNREQTLVGFAVEGNPSVEGVVAISDDDVVLEDLSELAEEIESTVGAWSR